MTIRYAEYPPAPRFARLVDTFWILEGRSDGSPDAILPDGRLEIIFHFGVAFHRHHAAGGLERQGPALVAGQLLEPVVLSFTGLAGVAAIRLHPAAAGVLLRCSIASLTGRIVALGDVLPSCPPLRERLAGSAGDEERVGVLQEFLGTLDAAAPDPAVEYAVNEVLRSGGCTDLLEVAARAGVSARTLQRLFLYHVGISPKHFARIARLQAALRHVRGGAPLADVALSCGYYDQAHMALDFRRLAAVSPSRWREHSGELAPLFAGC
jgi:AraC-like DNA-binding protein